MNTVLRRSMAIVVAAVLVIVGGVLMIAPGPAHGALLAVGIVLELAGFSVIGFSIRRLGETQNSA